MPTPQNNREKYLLMLDEEREIEAEVADPTIEAPPFLLIRIGSELEPRLPLNYFRREDIPPRFYQSEISNGIWLCLPFADESDKQRFLRNLIDSESYAIVREPADIWWQKSVPLPPLE